MNDKPFLPVGQVVGQAHASGDGDVAERVGHHLLEALESLDAVCRSAAFFAEIAGEASIGEYTLARCLDAVHSDCGAIYVIDAERPELYGERNGGSSRLRPEALHDPELTARATFHNGAEARRLLRPGAHDHNVLTCPIHVGSRLLGLVALLSPPQTPFTTPDVKLVMAVASQAAIALSRAQHHHAAEVERQKLRLVVQNHNDGIVVLDPDGSATLCNPVAREYCGTTDVLPLLQSLDATCTMASLGRGPTERELTLGDGERRRVVQVKSRDVRGADGELANVLLTLRDVTRQHREERLKRDSLSLISHKLRTPLTALVCAAQMMAAVEPADRAPFADEVHRRAQDLGALIDRLLNFAELLEGSWSRRGVTDLRTLATDLETHFRAARGTAPLTIVWDLQPGATDVPVPMSRLRVALTNLIDNAIKFGDPGQPWVRISSQRAPGSIVLEIEDRGPGIPVAERTNLFATFHQVETDFTGNVPGAGIGLAMVREVVTRLGGTLDLRDAEPHGCVFTLTFPTAEEAGQP